MENNYLDKQKDIREQQQQKKNPTKKAKSQY